VARVIRKQPHKQLDEKKEQLINELLEMFNKIGYKVRIEKGNFKGGFCLLREERTLLLNRTLEQDKKINFLLKTIADIGIDDIYIKPHIREMIENQLSL
jgi:hypothetical protein